MLAGKAMEVCKDGLEAKVNQNPNVVKSLLETGDKKIVECVYDRLWDGSIPLHNPSCLDKTTWAGQGILGLILTEIRTKLKAKTEQYHTLQSI